jgi:hypothetical protein
MEENYYRELLGYKANHEMYEHQSRMNALIQIEEYNLVSLLKPKIYIDGNQWCVLYGENIQDGVAGFGDSPQNAIYDFNKAFTKGLKDV